MKTILLKNYIDGIFSDVIVFEENTIKNNPILNFIFTNSEYGRVELPQVNFTQYIKEKKKAVDILKEYVENYINSFSFKKEEHELFLNKELDFYILKKLHNDPTLYPQVADYWEFNKLLEEKDRIKEYRFNLTNSDCQVHIKRYLKNIFFPRSTNI